MHPSFPCAVAVAVAAIAMVVTGCASTAPPRAPATDAKPTSPETHPATREECMAVLDKNIDVKLKSDNVTDAEAVERLRTLIREQLKPDVDKCVGTRVTDPMIACVKAADTGDAIDRCLQ